MFSISTAPAKQSVTETITTLSGRLGSATLLEDRRAAILGLRSFSKDYPASVASGALRSLIGSLSKDGEDVDTVKVVLETLLMLFNPNEKSPEASDEIALWLADEFTQRQENITLLLDFLESADFYSRLYSLQLLGAILSARTERTEECIFTAPLGISRLVAVLDDQREAVRNEAVGLLTYLTPSSVEIQKLVAFENAFERIFGIIEADGALAEGGRTVEDCLIFLANLLRRNPSNQSLFRESGFIARLADLLGRLLKALDQDPDLANWAQAQRNRNTYAFLAVLRLFLPPGSPSTPQNQAAFWKHGLAYLVLQLAFNRDSQTHIKAEALVTCGDIIRDNAALQEGFAQLTVFSPLEAPEPGSKEANGRPMVYVIDGLLDLTLGLRDLSSFDVRFAACECLKAYFSNHTEVRLHFLARAVEGHSAGHDDSANVLSVLLRPSVEDLASDPYRLWFAAVITFHLLYENPAAKAKVLSLTEGDAESGEEVVTSLQTIAAHLISGFRRDDDPRIIVGYLMLLLGWVFEDLDAVNDLLSEASNVQSLIQAVLQPAVPGGEIVKGLCVMLLGVAYEFSTKDSPIPRVTLHSVLTSRLSRDTYLDRLVKLRSHPLIREYDVTPQKIDLSIPGQQAEVFFDATFVNFLKDNHSRVMRAIDREPGMEISVMTNGVQKGISRELVDSLRSKITEQEEQLQALETRMGQEQVEQRRGREELVAETGRLRAVNEGLQRTHEAEMRKLLSQLSAKDVEHEKHMARVQAQYASKDAEHERKISQIQAQLGAKDNEQNKATARFQAQLAAKDSEHEKAIARMRSEAAAKDSEYEKQLARMRSEAAAKNSEHEKQLANVRKTVEADAERVQRRTEAEVADLKATISRLEVDLMKANKSKTQELQKLREEHAQALRALQEDHKQSAADQASKLKDAETKVKDLERQAKESKSALTEAQSKVKKAESATAEADAARTSTQSELDDLLMVFGDLEEKVAKYKARLKELGDDVSDAEDDDEDDDDE